MSSLIYQPESPVSSEPLPARLDPSLCIDPLLDGCWWPKSTDLGVELCTLLPVLSHVRGPVTRLLLGVGNWTARPHRITTGGRTVSIGYAAGQPSALIKVFCVDGGTFAMRVAPPGPAPDPPEAEWDKDVWETEGGRLSPLQNTVLQ